MERTSTDGRGPVKTKFVGILMLLLPVPLDLRIMLRYRPGRNSTESYRDKILQLDAGG